MLLTDTAQPFTADDLYATDSQAQRIVDAEDIVLDGPAGVCQRTRDYCVNRLMANLATFASWPNTAGYPAGYLQSIYTSRGSGPSSTKLAPNQMVMVEAPGQWSVVKNWMVTEGLKRLYQQALGSNLNDKHLQKLGLWEKIIKSDSWITVQRLGISAVGRPIARPAAALENNSGTWDATNLTAVAGTGAAGIYDVAITYVDQTQQLNNESGPTDTLSVTLLASQNIRLDFSTLVPPIGNVPQPFVGVYLAGRATGINVYAGPTGKTLRLQNFVPIPISVTSLGLAPALGSTPVGTGQYRDFYQAMYDQVERQ